MKKFLSLCLVLCMIAAMLCGCQDPVDDPHANEDPNANPTDQENPATDFIYQETESGGIMIGRYKGEDPDVIIPARIDQKNVTEIGSQAFAQNETLRSVKMPDTVTAIGREAFKNCTNLTSVQLSNSLSVISTYAFYGCTALKHVRIPATLTRWESAFPCSGLESVDLAEGLELIDFQAFAYTKLKEVVLPSSVKEIDSYAFNNCTDLEAITLNQGLLSVGYHVFSGESKLAEITIPQTVTDLNEMAFEGCDSLQKIIFEGDCPTNYVSEELGLFPSSSNHCTIYYHRDAKGFASPWWMGYRTQIIEDVPTTIPVFFDFEYIENAEGGVSVLKYVGNAAEVSIPAEINGKSVTTIEMSAFLNCDTVVSVTVPDTVTAIKDRAFAYCSALTSVVLSKNLQSIGAYAFLVSNISAITLPDGLTKLGAEAFSNCRALTQINIPGSLTHIEDGVFYFSGLEVVVLEQGVQTIGESAFADTNIKEVILPESVTTVSREAFSSCSYLESVTLNEGLISIGYRAFCACERLVEIVIPSTVTTVDEMAFTLCNQLEKVKFEGDAPSTYLYPDETARYSNYKIYYHSDAQGFTSPEWFGYETEIW